MHKKTAQIPVDISHILGNLITVIFDYQILRKPLKILNVINLKAEDIYSEMD